MARNVGHRHFRGLLANIPALFDGEVGWTTDAKRMFVGQSGVNYPINIPVFDATGVLQLNQHIVTGKATVPSGGTVTITLSGSAAFTSATSYTVYVTDNIVKRTLNVVQNSGTSFAISGGGTGDVIQYFCIGN